MGRRPALPLSLPGSSLVFPSVPGHDIVAELGQGGMGIVYKAFDRRRQRMVALKTLQGLTPTALYRFKKEFHTLAEVTHPNLITLFEPISDGTRWFFTMELVEGIDFLRHVRGGVLASARTLYDDDVTRALPRLREPLIARPASAPNKSPGCAMRCGSWPKASPPCTKPGKLHRDIKPGNVLVTPQGRVVLARFRSGDRPGTRGGSREQPATPGRHRAVHVAGADRPASLSRPRAIGTASASCSTKV